MVGPLKNFGPAIRSNTILPPLQKPTKNGITTTVGAIFRASLSVELTIL